MQTAELSRVWSAQSTYRSATLPAWSVPGATHGGVIVESKFATSTGHGPIPTAQATSTGDNFSSSIRTSAKPASTIAGAVGDPDRRQYPHEGTTRPWRTAAALRLIATRNMTSEWSTPTTTPRDASAAARAIAQLVRSPPRALDLLPGSGWGATKTADAVDGA